MDQQLFFLINQRWTNPVQDWFMAALSCFDAWAPIFTVLVLTLLWRGDFRMRAFLVTMGLIVAINDGVIAHALKQIVDRPRPHQVLDGVRQVDLAQARPRIRALFQPATVRLSFAATGEIDGRSFPSGHTTNCFSAALVGFCFFGWRAWWGFVIAALVGYSRIYNGAHWPSDVVTSIFLAFGLTFLLLALAEQMWQRAGRRWLPAVHATHPRLLTT